MTTFSKLVLLLVQANHGFDLPCGSHRLLVVLKFKKKLFISVVATATRIYLRMKDILRTVLRTLLVCVPSRLIENVWFILAITASQWRNVLFNPYLSDVRPRYFVFLSFSRVVTCSKLIPSHH